MGCAAAPGATPTTEEGIWEAEEGGGGREGEPMATRMLSLRSSSADLGAPPGGGGRGGGGPPPLPLRVSSTQSFRAAAPPPPIRSIPLGSALANGKGAVEDNDPFKAA